MKAVPVPANARIVDTSQVVTYQMALGLKAAGVDVIWRYCNMPNSKYDCTRDEASGITRAGLGLMLLSGGFLKGDWSVQDAQSLKGKAFAVTGINGFSLGLDLEGNFGNDGPALAQAWNQEVSQEFLAEDYIGPGWRWPAPGNASGLWHSGAIVPVDPKDCNLIQSPEANQNRAGVVVDIDTPGAGPGPLVMCVDDSWSPTAAGRTLLPDLVALAFGQPGDTAGQKTWRAVQHFVGASLHSHPELLTALASVDDPDDAAVWAQAQTNCATTMRWILSLIGCPSKFVTRHDQVGLSMTWILQAAQEMGALVPSSAWASANQGWCVHYGNVGVNNDHVEWLGSKPGAGGIADHAGGGRADNAITAGRDDIRWSVGRPIENLIDIDKMGIPLAEPTLSGYNGWVPDVALGLPG